MVINSLSIQGDKLWNALNTRGGESIEGMKIHLKLLVFKLLPKLFPPENESSYSRSTQMINMYCLRIVETIFTISFLWCPGASKEDSTAFDSLWIVISFARPDNICSRLSIFSTCAYAFVSMVLVMIVLTGLIIVFTLKNYGGKTKFFSMTAFLVKILSTVLYLPCITILLIIAKYWITGESFVTEYNKKIESLPAILSILAIVGIAPLIFFAYVYNILIYECRHHFFRLSMYSRSHSNIEFLKFYFQTITVFMYITILRGHQEIFRTLVALESIYLIYSYHRYRPFYSPHTTAAHMASHSSIAGINFCLLFGYLSDNNNIAFTFIIFVVPFFIGIVYYLSLKSLKRKEVYTFESCKNIFEFEISLRTKLLKHNKSEKIIEQFSKTYSETNYGKDSILVLWLSNYCFYTMEDDSLARIKLAIEVNDKGSLDNQYQIYQLKTMVLSAKRDYNEEIDYLNFRYKYEELIKRDELLCAGLINFLHQIESGTDLKSMLKDMIPLLADLISSVSQEYTYLVLDYPKSSSLLTSYATFLENILNDKQKANELLKIKSAIDDRHRVRVKEISYFDEQNGMMLISGSSGDFSIITHVNDKLCRILKQQKETIIGNSISAYVPYPFNINHESHMKRYLLYCTNPEIKLPLNLFLQNQSGFLIECLIQVKCTALDGFPFFIVLMKKHKAVREIAILNSNGLILNHSESFPKVLGLASISVKGEMIDSYLENSIFANMVVNSPYILIKDGRRIAVVRSSRLIKNKKVDILFLIYNSSEIILCEQGYYAKDIEYASQQKIEIENSTDANEVNKTAIKRNAVMINEVLNENIYIEDQKNLIVQQRDMHLYNPLKSIASSASLKENSFSADPKFLVALGLITRLKWIFVLIVAIVLSLQTAGSAILTENYRIHRIDEISITAELAYYLADIAVITRGLYLNEDDIFKSTNYNKLATTLNKLKNSQNTFRDVIKETKCETSKIFPKTLEFKPISSKIELNEILNIVQNIKTSIGKILKSNDTIAYEYCVLNSLSTSLQLVKSFEQLKDCKIEKVQNSTKSGTLILLFNGFFSVLTFFIIGYGWFMLKKIYETIWVMFSGLTKKNLSILSERVTERLVKIHKSIGNQSNELINNKKKEASSNYSSFCKFSIYLITYTIMISSFYILIFFYTIPSLIQVTNIQPSALYISYNALIQVTFLKFWEREDLLNIKHSKMFKPKNFYSSPEQEIDKIRTELKKIQKFFLKEEFLSMIKNTDDIQMILNTNGIIEGEYGMLNNIILYSFDINSKSDSKDLLNFENHIEAYNEFMSTFLESIKSDVNEYYDKKYRYMLIYTLLYFFGELFIFFYIFLVQLNNEQKKIVSIRKLSEFIPIKS